MIFIPFCNTQVIFVRQRDAKQVNASPAESRDLVAEGGGALGDRCEQRRVSRGGAAVSPAGTLDPPPEQGPPAGTLGPPTGKASKTCLEFK